MVPEPTLLWLSIFTSGSGIATALPHAGRGLRRGAGEERDRRGVLGAARQLFLNELTAHESIAVRCKAALLRE